MADIEMGPMPTPIHEFVCKPETYNVSDPSRPVIRLKPSVDNVEDSKIIETNRLLIDFDEMGKNTILYLGRQPQVNPGVNIDPSIIDRETQQLLVSRAHGQLSLNPDGNMQWTDTSSNGSSLYNPAILDYAEGKLEYKLGARTVKGLHNVCEVKHGNILQLAEPDTEKGVPGIYLFFIKEHKYDELTRSEKPINRWVIERVPNLNNLTSKQARIGRSKAYHQVEEIN